MGSEKYQSLTTIHKSLGEAARAETRITDTSEVARQTVVAILGPGTVSFEALDAIAGDIEGVLKVTPLAEFISALRSAAERQLARIAESVDARGFSAPKVDRKMAEKAVQYFLNKLTKADVKGDLAVAFDLDPDVNFREALLAMRSRIGLAVFPKARLKQIDPKVLKGMPYQAVERLRGLRLPLNVENSQAVPVVNGEAASAQVLDAALFDVGVEAGEVRNEPFLDVVEKVVQIVTALTAAGRLAKASELKDPVKADELRAALLKQIFDAQGASNVISVKNGRILVNRTVLRDFVTQYIASQTLQQAA